MVRFQDIHFLRPWNAYCGSLPTIIRVYFMPLLRKLPAKFPRFFVRAGAVHWGVRTLVLPILLPCRSNLYYVIFMSKPGPLLPVAALSLPGHLMVILSFIVQVPN